MMALSEVADRYGLAVLARLAGVLLLFLLARLARVPFVVVVRVLAVAMARLDAYAATRITFPPSYVDYPRGEDTVHASVS